MADVRMDNFIAAILEGDCAASVSQAEHLQESGVACEEIVRHGIEAAMSTLDAKCTLEQFNLLEIMLAGRAVMEVMKLLYAAGTQPPGARGTVIVAALEGDVHDLGKNILRMVLIANGYRVVDCGKDCPVSKLIDVVAKERPLAIGISGLITSIIPQVRLVKDELARRGLQSIKVLAGGAALKQSSPDKLNVDFVAESAFDCLRYLREVTEGGK